MYVIQDKDGKIYNGSFSETRHIWSQTSKFHFHCVVFPLEEEAEDVNQTLDVEGTKVVPIKDISY
ncbi:MAG: hypothetical protein ACXW07_08040 [Nitrososphaeraceae archaeon]